MRLLIHYVGDFHQPLHLTEVVDKENPKGDLGGNTFNLKGEYGVKNLHSLWDSVLYEFNADVALPFNSSEWKSFGTEVDSLTKKHSITKAEKQNVDFDDWAAE